MKNRSRRHKVSSHTVRNLEFKALNDIKGKTLAHAFVILRREGLRIRVVHIDDALVCAEKDPGFVNVDVSHGIIKRSWTS